MSAKISADELHAKKCAGDDVLLILDAREPAEFEVSHIHGAVNLPITTSSDEQIVEAVRRASLGGKKHVVCHCLMGRRGAMLATKLASLMKDDVGKGLVELYELDGSLAQWALAGKPMVDRHGNETKEINLDKAPPETKALFKSS
jgi:rhodanese-related sulfurtransferase